jgi:hypothetical protein
MSSIINFQKNLPELENILENILKNLFLIFLKKGFFGARH